jgi:transposase
VEAAGHYHRPLPGLGVWPAGWEVVELSPARVAEQRRVQGRRRVKTDAIDLEAITELVLAGHGVPVTARVAAVAELTGWAMQRGRRVQTRTAMKNQLLAQLDRCFPGLTMVLPDVLGTKVGRLVAVEFADPRRLAALGVTRFIRFAANRGLRVRRSTAERLVAAARAALPAPEAQVAGQVLADDLVLLACLDAQIAAAEAQLAQLLPGTPFAPLTTVPGWGTVRAAN